MIGARHDGSGIPGVAAIIRENHTDRQSTLLVRVNAPIDEFRWSVLDVDLEDLILAYLGDHRRQGNHADWGVPA